MSEKISFKSGPRAQSKLYEAPAEGQDAFVFETIAMEDMPAHVAMFLEERKQQEERMLKGGHADWDRAFVVRDSKIKSYIATCTIKEIPVQFTFLVDTVGENDAIAGEGKMLKKIGGEVSNLNGAAESCPAYTENKRGFRGMGLGERRLSLMNAWSRKQYGTALYSSYLINYMAQELWEDLEERGRAVETEYLDAKGKHRFRFVK